MATTPRIYKVRDVMVQLQVSKGTVYRLVRAGKLRLVKIGAKSSGITAESIDALLASNTKASEET
ncbi:helix-turn-helix transcriptional regulator [Burkholderia glumae]|uniref:Helix-turn-helix domain-containing protein n=1 Tax=Burkholderia glumae TaxID=337 RepID=A0ABY5BE06_BURGL|nr:helix-turn-helix domain-containing protein [Burkholderia glumae]USS45113.1 helix-turn-helix domain-containing protein [Burkholderia glumae]